MMIRPLGIHEIQHSLHLYDNIYINALQISALCQQLEHYFCSQVGQANHHKNARYSK